MQHQIAPRFAQACLDDVIERADRQGQQDPPRLVWPDPRTVQPVLDRLHRAIDHMHPRARAAADQARHHVHVARIVDQAARPVPRRAKLRGQRRAVGGSHPAPSTGP